jgi:hypothetical protein
MTSGWRSLNSKKSSMMKRRDRNKKNTLKRNSTLKRFLIGSLGSSESRESDKLERRKSMKRDCLRD